MVSRANCMRLLSPRSKKGPNLPFGPPNEVLKLGVGVEGDYSHT